MILLDANILLYSYNREVAEHHCCSEWLKSVLDQEELLGIPWHCLMAFLKLSTVPRGPFRALSLAEAMEIIDGWIEHPQVVIPEPGRRFRRILQEVGLDSQTRGLGWSDTYLAALAIEQGASLATFDRDFRKFKNLKLIEL